MKNHINVIAILHIVFGALPIFILLLLLYALQLLSSQLIEAPHFNEIAQHMQLYELIYTLVVVIFAFFICVNIFGIIGGIGLFGRHNWARIITLIVSGFRAFSFPLGTGLAVYSFIVLVDREVIREFKKKAEK